MEMVSSDPNSAERSQNSPPHATHLSCLSLHTATITSRFPKMAIRITAERNVSSTTFSTDLKPSLELKDTHTHTHLRKWRHREKKINLFPHLSSGRELHCHQVRHTFIVHLIYANVCPVTVHVFLVTAYRKGGGGSER